MFRIGLIDHYLDEWHANNYPQMLRDAIAAQNLEMEVHLAWAECDKPGGMTNAAWSERQGVPLAPSLEALVSACDGVMILAPSFPERHLDYATPALKKGIPVYMDKIFAPSVENGWEIFNLSKACGAPLFSSSALRFDPALDAYREGKGLKANWCLTCGPNNFDIYAIHQMEMLQTVMGHPGGAPLRVKALGNEGGRTLLFDFGNGRVGQMAQMNTLPFQLTVSDGTVCCHDRIGQDFFQNLVRAILCFFQTGTAPVPPEDTLAALAMLSAGRKALGQPDTWVVL